MHVVKWNPAIHARLGSDEWQGVAFAWSPPSSWIREELYVIRVGDIEQAKVSGGTETDEAERHCCQIR